MAGCRGPARAAEPRAARRLQAAALPPAAGLRCSIYYLTSDCLLCTICCLLPTVYFLLPTTYYLLLLAAATAAATHSNSDHLTFTYSTHRRPADRLPCICSGALSERDLCILMWPRCRIMYLAQLCRVDAVLCSLCR